MADRRRGKQKRQQELTENPSKEEKAVAKHLRFSLPTKEGKLVSLPVQYFIASDAVNCLLESKWAKKGKTDTLFTTRSTCVDYCNKLLHHGMFHRAAKQERRRDKDRDIKKKKIKDEVEEAGKEEEKKSKKDKKSKKREKEEALDKKEDSGAEKEDKTSDKKDEKKSKEDDKDEKKEEEKKKKRKQKKLKLEMVDNQVFKDGDEIYVWIYDPVPLKTFVIGLFLVLGAIGVCLFPLWPPEVRLGVYYLSLSVAGCIGFILVLCIVRVILFAFIWVVTLGRHHFWFLPNLNEDVGVKESFQPLYYHKYYPAIAEEDKDKSDSDSGEKKDNSDKDIKDTDTKDSSKEPEASPEIVEDKESVPGSESENDNGYEIVDAEDLAQGDDNCSAEEDKKDK